MAVMFTAAREVCQNWISGHYFQRILEIEKTIEIHVFEVLGVSYVRGWPSMERGQRYGRGDDKKKNLHVDLLFDILKSKLLVMRFFFPFY